MQSNVDATEKERILAVLNFWHKIEFFIPFDLSGRLVPVEGKSHFWLHAQTLDGASAALSHPSIPEDKEISGFTLFLGVFSKSEISAVGKHFDHLASDICDDFEDAERSSLDGNTCFASLQLTPSGQPIFETFSVSTLPWALGQVHKAGLSSLSLKAFADSQQQLSELLQNIRAQRYLRYSSSGNATEPSIDTADIVALHELLCDWAGFAGQPENPVALVEIRFQEKPERTDTTLLPQPRDSDAPGTDHLEQETTPKADDDIGILNSFFIEDIERAIACVENGIISEPLRRYLTPLAPGQRIDLYSEDGRQAILQGLHPDKLNHGRWLSDAHHTMSLMQQFAINSAITGLSETGLFSVNGPPGTGKTTLLRDMFADNIVRRSRILAALKTARHAFDGPAHRVTFADRSVVSISALIPALTGFEMVVASSNNAAVENISRDLPRRGSIAKNSSFEYLQTVAHKIAAQKDNGAVVRLSDEDRPWGLIACALGNSRNRRAFKERFAFMEVEDRPRPNWSGQDKPQTIWQWIKSYNGPTFAEATAAFQTADSAVRDKIGQYARYADLHREIALVSQDAYCSAALDEVAAAATDLRHLQDQDRKLATEIQDIGEKLSSLIEEERLLGRSAPVWWKRLLFTSPARQHRQSVVTNAQRQLQLRARMDECETQLQRSCKPAQERALLRYKRCEQALLSRRETWSAQKREFDRLAHALDHPATPEHVDDLEKDRFQIEGLWNSSELAGLRSMLFEAALKLHEAWLADVGSKGGGFGGNIVAICKLLSNVNPARDPQVASIWQSLFMIVPVVSTTFASLARQFRGLGPHSIGWIFIDEAGQAVPQAAVGALWRAQRAMVIGDPLQIEPVFTLPGALISALSTLSRHTASGEYAPNTVSVQTLADAANRYGTMISREEADGLWIGSPLRVHRRCIDPMFTLANRIAYQNRMVYGLADRRPVHDVQPFYGDSAWIDIKGKVSGRQAVGEQTDFIVDVLTATYYRDGVLPDLYIISPFKDVKNRLKQALAKAEWTTPGAKRPSFPPKLSKWLQERIGTVHTFQGKEEDSVFMVLGADHDHTGATGWASSKPNLLNVALTRAKRRFYIVADRTLWEKMPYFRETAETLEQLQPTEFLERNKLKLPVKTV